jgi:glutamyl-tRNA synthetase
MTPAESAVVAQRCLQVLANLPDISSETVEPPMRALVDELGLRPGQVFGILRAAVTGQTVSPPLFESMAIIGKDKVSGRIKNAIALLEKM